MDYTKHKFIELVSTDNRFNNMKSGNTGRSILLYLLFSETEGLDEARQQMGLLAGEFQDGMSAAATLGWIGQNDEEGLFFSIPQELQEDVEAIFLD